jgi:hypothetical protein
VNVELPEDILAEIEENANTNIGGAPSRPFTDEEIAIMFRGRERAVTWGKICELMERSSGRPCNAATARKKYRELGGT